MAHVLIFKTNVESEEQLQQASLLLNATDSIIKWNIDREDIDKVLRVESTLPHINDIMKIMMEAGFSCEELVD
ncbi:MAG: hypothetical protein JWM14_141 [Chitinophagaceae bacterium]|nr:hypothetical protein [Chitinophagaceae bacterium]